MERNLKESKINKSKINKRVITIAVTYDLDDLTIKNMELNDSVTVEKIVSEWTTDYFGDEEVPISDLKVSCEDFYEED